MDIFKSAQRIIFATEQQNESAVIKKEGDNLLSYFQKNIDKIEGRDRHSFHIGSAMYFFKDYVEKETDSTKHKLTTLIAYIKLYESISYQDMQSLAGAYRLHILFVDEKDFFYPRLMKLLVSSLNELFEADSRDISKQLEKLFYSAQYTMFYYCMGESPYVFEALNVSEKERFEQIFATFKKEHKVCKFEDKSTIDLGVKVLNSLYRILCESDLGSYMHFGMLV